MLSYRDTIIIVKSILNAEDRKG